MNLGVDILHMKWRKGFKATTSWICAVSSGWKKWHLLPKDTEIKTLETVKDVIEH